MTRILPVTLAVATLAISTTALAQVAVFDPNVFARQFEQLTELRKQVETVTSQLKVAREQLSEAKALYDSFNKLTNVNDIAGLLNSSEFREHLPTEFAQIESLLSGQDGYKDFAGAIDSYLGRNRYYVPSEANSFYERELDRIARQTGAKHSLGQSVYDTASKRIDQLDDLRRQISRAKDVKDVLDLSARLQAEQAFLQNDVLRMQGLAMIQQAQADMDQQRERERGRQLVEEMKGALR